MEKQKHVITEEINNDLILWSEGNPYLYSLLYICWENGIKTHACCSGHEDYPNPYIGIILDEASMPFVSSIIASVENMENINLSTGYRKSLKIQLPDEERKRFILHCEMHNRCEMFFKMAAAIQGQKMEIQTPKGQAFFKKVVRFQDMSLTEIEQYIKDGVTFDSVFCTKTEEFIVFQKKERLYGNALLKLFSNKIKKESKEFLRKYRTQETYSESPKIDHNKYI